MRGFLGKYEINAAAETTATELLESDDDGIKICICREIGF